MPLETASVFSSGDIVEFRDRKNKIIDAVVIASIGSRYFCVDLKGKALLIRRAILKRNTSKWLQVKNLDELVEIGLEQLSVRIALQLAKKNHRSLRIEPPNRRAK